MAVPPAPDDRSGVTGLASSDPDSRTVTPKGATLRLALLVLLTLAVLVAAGILVWLLAERRGEAAETQDRRDEVMSVARSFMQRINTYGPDELEGKQMPRYREEIGELITPKFRTDFEQNVPAAEATVAQAGLARTTEVHAAGVAALDADSATVLAAGQFTNSYPRQQGSAERVESEPLSYRVEVRLVLVEGEWKVDDFTPITPAEEGQQ